MVSPEKIEIDAGISRFDKYKQFNVIYALANGDVTKYDAVFNMTYDEAFVTLFRRADELRFTRELNRLRKQPQ